MVYRYSEGLIYKKKSSLSSLDKDLINTARVSVTDYEKFMDQYQLSQALASIWGLVSRSNRYVEESSPWALNKEKKTGELHNVLYNMVEIIRIISIVLEPFMPGTAEDIWTQIGSPGDFREQGIKESREWGLLPDGFRMGKPRALFPKIE